MIRYDDSMLCSASMSSDAYHLVMTEDGNGTPIRSSAAPPGTGASAPRRVMLAVEDADGRVVVFETTGRIKTSTTRVDTKYFDRWPLAPVPEVSHCVLVVETVVLPDENGAIILHSGVQWPELVRR